MNIKMVTRKKNKPLNSNRSKGNIDYNLAVELNLVMENEKSEYDKEMWLGKNYAKKYNKGKFNFAQAKQGVKNQLVTPFARKYQNDWGLKVGQKERDAVTKARLRAIMMRIRNGDFK